MNNLEILKSQLADINNKRVRIQTLKDQAQKNCDEILKKYNVANFEELTHLKEATEKQYNEEIQKAQEYISYANIELNKYQGLL